MNVLKQVLPKTPLKNPFAIGVKLRFEYVLESNDHQINPWKKEMNKTWHTMSHHWLVRLRKSYVACFAASQQLGFGAFAVTPPTDPCEGSFDEGRCGDNQLKDRGQKLQSLKVKLPFVFSTRKPLLRGLPKRTCPAQVVFNFGS